MISSLKYFGGGDSLWNSYLLSTNENSPTAFSNVRIKGLLFNSLSSGFSSSAILTASVYELFNSGTGYCSSYLDNVLTIDITLFAVNKKCNTYFFFGLGIPKMHFIAFTSKQLFLIFNLFSHYLIL